MLPEADRMVELTMAEPIGQLTGVPMVDITGKYIGNITFLTRI